jgi:energy-coupling factor transporter ATP-binding protein EcfA2
MMIFLAGTHGAGKTTLVRNLAKLYGIEGDALINASPCDSLALLGPYRQGRKAGGMESILGDYGAEMGYEMIEAAWQSTAKVIIGEGKPWHHNKLLNFFKETNEKYNKREVVVLALRITGQTSLERRLSRTGKEELTDKQEKYTMTTADGIYDWVRRSKFSFPEFKWLDVWTQNPEGGGHDPKSLVKYVLREIFPDSALESLVRKYNITT